MQLQRWEFIALLLRSSPRSTIYQMPSLCWVFYPYYRLTTRGWEPGRWRQSAWVQTLAPPPDSCGMSNTAPQFPLQENGDDNKRVAVKMKLGYGTQLVLYVLVITIIPIWEIKENYQEPVNLSDLPRTTEVVNGTWTQVPLLSHTAHWLPPSLCLSAEVLQFWDRPLSWSVEILSKSSSGVQTIWEQAGRGPLLYVQAQMLSALSLSFSLPLSPTP